MAGNFELKALWLCKFLGRNSERCGNFVWKTSFYYHSWKWKITEFKINQFPAITSMTRVIHTQKKIQTSQKLQNANSSYNRFQSKYFHRTHHPFHTLPGMLRLVEAIVDGKPQRLHFISGAIVRIKCVLLIFATAHISLHLHIHVTFYIYLKTFPKKIIMQDRWSPWIIILGSEQKNALKILRCGSSGIPRNDTLGGSFSAGIFPPNKNYGWAAGS